MFRPIHIEVYLFGYQYNEWILVLMFKPFFDSPSKALYLFIFSPLQYQLCTTTFLPNSKKTKPFLNTS